MIALCKGWLPGPLGLCNITTLWAASLMFADARTDCCLPLASTELAMPFGHLKALCHQFLRGDIILLIIPLSCNQGSLGSQ